MRVSVGTVWFASSLPLPHRPQLQIKFRLRKEDEPLRSRVSTHQRSLSTSERHLQRRNVSPPPLVQSAPSPFLSGVVPSSLPRQPPCRRHRRPVRRVRATDKQLASARPHLVRLTRHRAARKKNRHATDTHVCKRNSLVICARVAPHSVECAAVDRARRPAQRRWPIDIHPASPHRSRRPSSPRHRYTRSTAHTPVISSRMMSSCTHLWSRYC